MIVKAFDVGDRELGSTIEIPFNTQDATGAPAALTGGTFRVIDLATLTAYVGPAITVEVDILGETGNNRARIDTTDAFFAINKDYALQLTAGTVSGVSVAGVNCGSFSIGQRSDGLLLLRVIKCNYGTVTFVDPADPRRKFRGTFAGINTSVDDFYRKLDLTFQTGVNLTARSVLKYVAGTQEFTVQHPFPQDVEVGAKFALLPHERELSVYTAQIETEWGIAQGVGDRISVTLLDDGEAVINPASVVSNMRLQAWDWDTSLVVIDTTLTPSADGVYKFTGAPANARPPNEGLSIRATFTIDGTDHPFPRSIFNFV